MKREAFTKTEYEGFQQAYDFFNRELFDRSLPQVLVTLQRHAKTRGYFSPERFHGRIEKAAVHELALNPDSFTSRTDEMILSTLVHEMAHVWQQTHGTKRANTSFTYTYVGSYADSRIACQLISWQLPRGFERMEPSAGNARMEGFCNVFKHLETSPLNSQPV